MADFKIAAQMYTLRHFTKTAEDLDKTLKKVRDIGYEAIQVSGIGPIEPEKVKELTDKHGLEICATHVSGDRLKNDLDNIIKEHKLWECKYVGLGSMAAEYRKDKEGLMSFIKEFNEIALRLKDAGLTFIYHNHKFEFEKFDGKTMMDIIFENTDPEVFQFELDTYWVQAGGANPVDWIRKVDGRMDVIHFKDMMIKDDEQHFAEIGEGNLDWPEIIKACRETGVIWAPVEQDRSFIDPFESLKISFNNLQELMK